MLIASRLHFTPPPPIAPTVSLHRPVYLSCIMACTLVFTHSPTPLAVFCRRRPLRAVQMVVITWTAPAPLTDHIVSGVTGCHGRKKYRPIPILPNTCKYRPIPDNPIPVSFEKIRNVSKNRSSQRIAKSCYNFPWIFTEDIIKGSEPNTVLYRTKCLYSIHTADRVYRFSRYMHTASGLIYSNFLLVKTTVERTS